MEDFSAITAFVRVVEAKSFASAAAQLSMTPSGVSRAVSRLEEHLGVRLLFRSTRALRLTDDGASFYARCKEILADLAEATESLGYAHRKPQGKLRVGMSASIGRTTIVPKLDEFQRRYPEIRLELMMCDYPYDLNEEGVDCAIRMGELEDSSLIARKIGHLRNVLLASPEYLERYGTPANIDELKNHRCINYVYQNGKPRQWSFDTPDGRIEVDVNAHLLINDGESVIQAAMAGLGIIQAPHVMATCALEVGKLEPILTDTVSTGKNVWIVYPQKKHLSARVQAFIEWARELFERPFESVCPVAPVVEAFRPPLPLVRKEKPVRAQ